MPCACRSSRRAASARSTIWSRASATGHATAVLAASIFHFGTYTIAEAKAHMAAAGLPMRLDMPSQAA